MSRYPKIEYMEQGMRDGLQIEDANISVDDKLRLLDALGETGLKYINVGSFVSPKWTPQMARMDELMQRFKPKPGVKYTCTVLNDQGVERAKRYSPPLVIRQEVVPYLQCYLCDVFTRRNVNKSRDEQMARWPSIVAKAKAAGVTEAGIGLGAFWGSNWLGEFTLETQMAVLEKAHGLWDEAGIKVTRIGISDAMSWAAPDKVEESLVAIKKKWPEINYWGLHFHNARGLALADIYAALRVLEPTDALLLEGTLGGIGGCPYCGNGRAAGMVPTEDLMHMLERMGIETGVDLNKLIECVGLLEEMIQRRSFGHVANAGPCPDTEDQWYPMDLPFIETLEQAKHFKLGPKVYQGCINPWREPIRSASRPKG